ncbi:MAG: DUF6311 domain-containing protein [Lachnospiraceae bacterium]|nr:DUF6311 domain-containing protein [Lachnospiraceae bacterium]
MSLSSLAKNKRITVFFVSSLIGALVFLLIYGPFVLNPVYDDWIFETGERDLIQHYLGFCTYRSSPWQFPIGLVTTASYPHDMSVIYTDAIPLFAFFGKMLNPLLPRVFQYMGIYGFISFALMGGIGASIIYELTGKEKESVLSSLFYVLSWTVVYRMFYHTSLASQWLVLLAIYIWLTCDPGKNTIKNCVIYFVLSCVSILIHPYLWAMCGGIIIMSLAEYLIRTKKIVRALIYGADYCVTGLLALYVFGAFSGGVGAKLDVGEYEANMNTFYNSMNMGLLPGFSVALYQYEGFGYLGAGVLFLGVCAVMLMLIKKKIPHISLRRVMFVITAVCFTVFSIIPEISFNDKILLNIKLDKVSDYIVGIFRSNGRFIWPVCFILLTGLLVYMIRNMKSRQIILLLSFCVIIQAVDMMPFIKEKHRLFARSDYEHVGLLDNIKEVNDVIDNYKHIIMDIDDGSIDQGITYYAYLHGLTTNDFYYARPIENKVQDTLEALRNDMSGGRYDEGLLYLLGEDKLPLYKSFDLNFYEIDGRYLASYDPIPGLEKINK